MTYEKYDKLMSILYREWNKIYITVHGNPVSNYDLVFYFLVWHLKTAIVLNLLTWLGALELVVSYDVT